MTKPKLWRHTVGKKGVSRVTAYQRPDSPALYIEWWDDSGRHRQALKALTGHPVTDRELAVRIVEEASKKQEQLSNQKAAEGFLGVSPNRTLAELLEALHSVRGQGWSDQHARDQFRYREYWLQKLGTGIRLSRVTAAAVESVVAKEAHEKSWSPRTVRGYLRYLVDAFSFAERKLKWIDPRHNLSAVDMPTGRGASNAYTLAEVRRLLPALEEVHPEAGLIGHIAWQTGRRLSAILALRAKDVRFEEGCAVIRFPGETDKARKTGEAALVGKAARNLRALTERRTKARLFGLSRNDLIKVWLPNAESAAGIDHVPGRAWHGIKRAYATATEGIVGRDRQSGTREDTLREVYRQDEIGPKVELAETLASVLSGTLSGTTRLAKA